MNTKLKSKKGMTLIEVIISVALLAILIIPLSGLVMSSLKNNIDSEDMQKASYIGQKVLEELKAYDEITLQDNSTEKYFELLDGDKIVQKDKEFLGSFDRNVYGSPSNGKDKDIYRVEVKVEKDVNFQYENIDNLDKYNDVGFRLNFTSNKINDANITANKLIMELDQNLKKLVVSNENEATPILTIEKTDINKNIILDIRNDFYKDVNIEFINKSEEFVEIYMIKDGNNPSKMKLYSSSGNVILYEENKEEENKIGDMYNYTVTVKDKRNNLLFQGTSNNNVNIKLK